MDSDASLVVVGRQEIVAAAINGDMNRVAAQRNAVELFQVSGFRLNGESGESELAGQTAAHEKETLFGINGHGRGHSGQRVVGVMLQRAGGRVQRVLGDAVFLLERYVHESCHCVFLPCSAGLCYAGAAMLR